MRLVATTVNENNYIYKHKYSSYWFVCNVLDITNVLNNFHNP